MAESISLNQQDNNRALAVRVGANLSVSLPENATTGFKWQLDTYDANILRLESNTYLTPSTSGIGAGGNRLLTFRAIAPGQTVLRLLHRRSWEQPTNYAAEFIVNLTVHS